MHTRPPTTQLALLAAAAVTVALLAAGCTGISDPYASGTTRSRSATTPPAPDAGDPAAERGGTIPAATRAAQGKLVQRSVQPTPQAAVARYAQLYANWSAANVVARQRQLAAISLGQARTQALQAAASAKADTVLARSHVANTGEIVAIVAGEGPAAGEWVIVTREQTSGRGDYAGLPPTLHVTYSQVTRTPHGWVVSSWAPQS